MSAPLVCSDRTLKISAEALNSLHQYTRNWPAPRGECCGLSLWLQKSVLRPLTVTATVQRGYSMRSLRLPICRIITERTDPEKIQRAYIGLGSLVDLATGLR